MTPFQAPGPAPLLIGLPGQGGGRSQQRQDRRLSDKPPEFCPLPYPPAAGLSHAQGNQAGRGGWLYWERQHSLGGAFRRGSILQVGRQARSSADLGAQGRSQSLGPRDDAASWRPWGAATGV